MSGAVAGNRVLAAEFLERLASDRAAFARIAESAGPSGGLDDAQLRLVEALAHRLSGAAGVFGYPRVGDAAAALEDEVIAGRAQKAAPAGAFHGKLTAFIALLDDVLRHSGPPSEG